MPRFPFCAESASAKSSAGRAPLLSTLSTILAGVFLCVGIIVMARRRSGYSHVRDTISELGERGSSDSQRVNFGLFLPVALLLFGAAAMIFSSDERIAMLGVCIGVGYFASFLAPCDPGAPLAGSFRQTLHNVGGGIEYCGGALSLWLVAEEHGGVFFYSGWIVAIGVVAISIPGLPIRGLVQRVVETILFACMAYACCLAA
jgi:hypothetical protein